MRIVFVIICFIANTAIAQKRVNTYEQTWVGYIHQLRLSDKWGVTADVHLRSKDNFLDSLSTGVIRAGLLYHLSNDAHLAAGYAYFNYFPADDHAEISQPEHRPWQQVQWSTRFDEMRLQQRLRLEERFRKKIKDHDELADGYSFNYRARYQLFLFVPLSKKAFAAKTFSIYGGDEVLLNFGKQVTYNTFDHNRIHFGFTYHADNDDQLQLGYLNIFQQQGSGNRYRMVHVARIYYHHNIDLRNRRKK